MRFAQKYLQIVRKRGERGVELKRVYHNLRHRELFLLAYAKLSSNAGVLTPGVDPEDTIDGMSLRRIDRIIDRLTKGTYTWKPTQRVYVPKLNGKKRPIGMPGGNDKLLEEVCRLVLEAYYEPQFRDSSHGFRPRRGCHTALMTIQQCWTGTRWWIEGDIRGCFDHLDHEIILSILGRQIKDTRFLKLIKGMLQAGYVEDWRYHQTYSGTPQGGILSPLIANIVLNEVDRFIEDVLIPRYTRGKRKQPNPVYNRVSWQIQQAKRAHHPEGKKRLEQQRRRLPARMPNDPKYRRLYYIRYADDFLLGFDGPKAEAEEIKRAIGAFLASLGLELSAEKTLITHAATGKARFLNYDLSTMWNDTKVSTTTDGRTIRSANGGIRLSIPADVTKKWLRRVTKHQRITHRGE